MDDELKLLREISELQSQYKYLYRNNKLTKRVLCELVIPFRDRHHLSDMVALSITRGEISLTEMIKVLEEGHKKRPKLEELEKQTHNCEDCRHADSVQSNNMIYCLEHSCVMRGDNCCRDWSEED